MRIVFILILTILSSLVYGQSKQRPKNLIQALDFLNADCNDSLKLLIQQTEDQYLKSLSYPWGGEYKTIFEWTSDEDSEIVTYLKSKGIYTPQTEVILIAFKYFLNGQEINEEKIVAPYKKIELKWEKEDLLRFSTDSLRSVYIPMDLEDCFKEIDKFWLDSIKNKVKQWSEDKFTSNTHLGFGMWIRNNWQLWAGSRLTKYFNELGVHHPDDISGIILDSYHRYLNKRDVKLDEQIRSYKEYWANTKREEIKKKEMEFSAYKIGDTVLFNYILGYVSKEQEEKYDSESCLVKGIVVELNQKEYFIKVKLLSSCDKRGIIYFDNKNSMTYNPETKKMERPKKRLVKYMKDNEENWFNYQDWEIKN